MPTIPDHSPIDASAAVHAWPGTAKAFHWATALLVLAQLPLGWVAKLWPLSPLKLDLFVWHKSIGFTILLVVLLRAAYRSAAARPPWTAGMTPWQLATARSVHALLYGVLIAMPISGWVVSSASRVPFEIFWRIPVPAIAPHDKALEQIAARVHFSLFVALCVLLLLHIGAALWHHFAKRDETLVRMLPGRRSPS